jgi:hypothetical protein
MAPDCVGTTPLSIRTPIPVDIMAQTHESDQLIGRVHQALQQAVDFSFTCQLDDGHWVAPVSADATLTAQYVMFRHSIPGLNLDGNGTEAAA